MISFAAGAHVRIMLMLADLTWWLLIIIVVVIIILIYIPWSMVGMCTTNARIFKYPGCIPFQYLSLAWRWMDGYANGREKTLSWSEGVANLTVYHTK